jgi:DNA-directed RNA polymerase specialized sigma24 family protein
VRSTDCARANAAARLADQLQETGAGDPPAASAPDLDALDADEATAVRSALGSLPADQRQAIEMAFFRGLTHPEIRGSARRSLWAPSKPGSGAGC